MALNLSKLYTPIAGQVLNSSAYNTDIAALFNAFSGLEALTSSLGGLTILPASNSTTTFNVTNVATTDCFTVDTTNSIVNTKTDSLRTLIYSTTLSVAATTKAITGLAGDTDIMYWIRIFGKNGYAGNLNIGLYCNSDTTASNYTTQYHTSVSNIDVGSRGSSFTGNFLCQIPTSASSGSCFVDCILYAKSGQPRYILSESLGVTSTSTASIYTVVGTWSDTATEITQLVLYSDQTNGLGVGTNIQVWTRR